MPVPMVAVSAGIDYDYEEMEKVIAIGVCSSIDAPTLRSGWFFAVASDCLVVNHGGFGSVDWRVGLTFC